MNVYVLEDGDGLVLIDSGWALAESQEALAGALATLGCGLGDVRHFLVTHAHRDHYTQAVELRRIFGSKVSLGAGEHPAIRAVLAKDARPFEPQLRQLRASGAEVVIERLRALGSAPRSRPRGWEEPDAWLEPDQEIELARRTLRVVPTPGHTQGHVVFHRLRERAAVRRRPRAAAHHPVDRVRAGLGEPAARRLSGVAARGPGAARPAAAPGARPRPAGACTSASMSSSPTMPSGSTGAPRRWRPGRAPPTRWPAPCAWTRRRRQLADLDPFNQMLAVTETRIHLELLAAQGRLATSADGDVTVYAPAGRVTGPLAPRWSAACIRRSAAACSSRV